MQIPARTVRTVAALGGLLGGLSASGGAQESVSSLPLLPGLTLASTLHSPGGERENLVQVASADAGGVGYTWQLVEIRNTGDTIVSQAQRRVRMADLAAAPRLDPVFLPSDQEDRPGYTAFSISSAVYAALRDDGSAAYSVTSLETAGGLFDMVTTAMAGGALPQRVRYKGTLTRISPDPSAFPLLVDGRRVTVPALHLRGSFTNGGRRREYEFRVLADSVHPLLLQSVVEGSVYQLVRVNAPIDESGLERELTGACRLELPGVYFGFNSADIDPASDRSLAALARVLAGHPGWTITVEGHTDSIGTAPANQELSTRRAQSVRARLAERHGLATGGWKAVGYGSNRPRESNATTEGRARNRRVELARDC